MSHCYTSDFYRTQRDGARRSAAVIVPLAVELVRPRSVVDVGCGVGGWLAAFREHGVDDVLGLDGLHVDRHLLEIPGEYFRPVDLREPIRLSRRFDLVVSLEVAEHLPEACADTFVESLTSLGPAVLFSAAIPHQGGVGHVNEQWPEYWANRFAERGYLPIDCIRRRVWGQEAVDWWYAQNMLVYVDRDHIARFPQLAAAHAATAAEPLSIVHPRQYLALMEWQQLARDVRRDLGAVVPPSTRLILVDDEQLRADIWPEAVPFLERDGQYWGSPEDDATALRELERLRRAGAALIGIARPAFWWCERYPAFLEHLRTRFPCLVDNDRLRLFDLR